jgi:hypothetical protein
MGSGVPCGFYQLQSVYLASSTTVPRPPGTAPRLQDLESTAFVLLLIIQLFEYLRLLFYFSAPSSSLLLETHPAASQALQAFSYPASRQCQDFAKRRHCNSSVFRHTAGTDPESCGSHCSLSDKAEAGACKPRGQALAVSGIRKGRVPLNSKSMPSRTVCRHRRPPE